MFIFYKFGGVFCLFCFMVNGKQGDGIKKKTKQQKRSCYVVLVGLELTLQIRLSSNLR